MIDNNVLAVQKTFNQNPFGLKYNGPIDGIINDELISSLLALAKKIQEITGADIISDIIVGNKIITNSDELLKTFELIKKFQNIL